MSDKLRKAVARVRRMRFGDKDAVATFGTSNERKQAGQWSADNAMIVDAYLTAHPADGDELVDEWFVKLFGFEWYAGDQCFVRLVDDELGERRLEWYRDGKMVIGRTPGRGSGFITPAKTKHQLRSLLAALGVNK